MSFLLGLRELIGREVCLVCAASRCGSGQVSFLLLLRAPVLCYACLLLGMLSVLLFDMLLVSPLRVRGQSEVFCG